MDTSATVLPEVDDTKLRQMIVTWIINRQRPFSIVEDPELIEILQYINPTIQLVKADAIKNGVMALYDLGKRELKVTLWNFMKMLFNMF
jgi:hypothetical protein